MRISSSYSVFRHPFFNLSFSLGKSPFHMPTGQRITNHNNSRTLQIYTLRKYLPPPIKLRVISFTRSISPRPSAAMTLLACAGTCGKKYERHHFTKHQLKHGVQRHCSQCLWEKRKTLYCAGACDRKLPRTAFSGQQLRTKDMARCKDCVAARSKVGFLTCNAVVGCGNRLPVNAFSFGCRGDASLSIA